MSRSYRKPYYGNSDGAKEWKQEANRKLRRNKGDDLVDGSLYKRETDIWMSPLEHKHGYWDVSKMRRK